MDAGPWEASSASLTFNGPRARHPDETCSLDVGQALRVRAQRRGVHQIVFSEVLEPQGVAQLVCDQLA